MQDRWNLIFGVSGYVWSAIVALAVVPFYLRFLGIEAYGLIGFFIALQAIFAALDLGLSATMSREVARTEASGDPAEARSLLRTLAVVYWISGCAIGLGLALAAQPIADQWLHNNKLTSGEVRQAIRLMGLITAFRWPVALYYGALIGAGKLTHVSVINVLAATVINIGAVLILWLVQPTITAFFIWQAACTLIHVAVVSRIAWREVGGRTGTRFDRDGLKRIWRFSAGLSVAAIIGIIFTQSDKVVLSRIVTLSELGGYILAGTAARVVYIALTPTFNVIYPRMTAMVAAGQTEQLIRYYRFGTRLLIAAIVPCSTFVALYAHELLLIWTRSAATADKVASLVPIMLAGTVINGIMHFPYALQLAVGRSSLSAMINIILLLMYLPMLIYFVLHDGVFGAALAWLLLNAIYIVLGTWLTHRTVLRGIGVRWLSRDVAVPFFLAVAVTSTGAIIGRAVTEQMLLRLVVGGVFMVLATVLCALSCPPVLTYFRRMLSASLARQPV